MKEWSNLKHKISWNTIGDNPFQRASNIGAEMIQKLVIYLNLIFMLAERTSYTEAGLSEKCCYAINKIFV